MSCDRKLSPFAIAVLVVSVLGANVALAEPEQGFPNDSRYSWNNVTIVAGGFITGIVPNTAFKDVMYVRTDIGGAYRYDPFSNKWTPLNDIFSATDWNLMEREHCRRSRPALAGLPRSRYVHTIVGRKRSDSCL